MDILAQEKPKLIKLADGKDYELPAINLTTLANIEKTMGFGLNKFALKMDIEPMQSIRLLAYALLKETCPDITLEQTGNLITLKEVGVLSETISIIMAISG